MEINRYFNSKLNNWFNSTYKKPLIVRGARQVGKTHVIREWSRRNATSEKFVEINFEEQPAYKNIFEKDLVVSRILTDLQLSTGVNLEEKGSILFLDEIQECPNALMSLRYFAEKYPNITVIAAGSLIDFILEEISFPVGRIDNLMLHPLSFQEFLESIESRERFTAFKNASVFSNLPDVMHLDLLSKLRLYFRIGGMPEAVSIYAKSHSLEEVSKVHTRLIESYKNDFIKYSKKNDWNVLSLVFERVPTMISANRINYSKFDPALRGEKVKRALRLLQAAGIVNKVISTQAFKLPLSVYNDDRFFKLLFLDIGLMQAALGFDWRKLNPNAMLTNILDGAFAEQYVGQELICERSLDANYQPHYWYRSVKGSEAEVDYVIEREGKPIPVEIKSGLRGSLKSLALYNEKFSPAYSLVLSERNFEKSGNINWIPLYNVSKL